MKATQLTTLLIIIISHTIFGQETHNNKLAPLKVLVTDYSDNVKKGEQLLFEGVKSGFTYKGISDKNGEFDIQLKGGDTYLIKIKGVGEVTDYNKIEIPLLEEGYSYSPGRLTVKFELPKTFTLNNVHFDSGKPTLTKKSYAELKDLLEYMILKDDLVIEIAGHTDNVGEDETNLVLSQNRADAVKKYLISKGISQIRVSSKGYGENFPAASNDTAVGRQKNRRTEVRIIE